MNTVNRQARFSKVKISLLAILAPQLEQITFLIG